VISKKIARTIALMIKTAPPARQNHRFRAIGMKTATPTDRIIHGATVASVAISLMV